MLKRMELWNFESHVHTVIDDLSGDLNLLCGESNSGKTSIVRALKLVAYNDFDPKSVRVGKKTCKVLVESDRGKVVVERGKGVNTWEITKKGCKPETLEKVGVNVVPQAAEVVGLKMVKLGDVDVPVNIMDQLESHFMLSSVGGDKASGSMRAQIVDEISGLSGIEGVIKEVSLDKHRLGREVKRTEDDMNDTIAKLHSEDRIKDDEALVVNAQQLVQDSDDCIEAASLMEDLSREYSSVSDSVTDLTKELAGIPDFESARGLADKADEYVRRAVSADKVYESYQRESEEAEILETRQGELDALGDPGKQIEECKEALEVADNAERLYKEASLAAQEAESREKWLKGLSDPSEALKKAQEALEQAKAVSDTLDEISSVQGVISGLESDLKDAEELAKEIEKEKQEILAEVKVCPLTLGPVSNECLEQAGEVK